MAVSLHDLLRKMVDLEGTDLHITVGQHPVARIHGKLVPMTDFPKLTPIDTKRLCYSVLTDSQKKRLEEIFMNLAFPLLLKRSATSQEV